MSQTPPFHSLGARTLRGAPLDFASLKDRVVLVVNTASQCGFTPQYAGLEKLHQEYAPHGLSIIAFPCNQFGRQEPGGAESIEQTCQINYGVTFTVAEKVEVKGPEAHPVFAWLTRHLPGFPGRAVKWNFTKFLIARDGTPIRRFAPFRSPAAIEPHIRRALGLPESKEA